MTSLSDTLDALTRPARLVEPGADGALRCQACAHRCLIQPGKRGICQMRFNREGTLMVPWGYVAGLNIDPVEKKPFAHFLPGSAALTFGMLGCNFHCDFCQNWVSSQTLRDPAAHVRPDYLDRAAPEQIVALAVRNRAPILVSSYNEPLITAEWAADIFRLGKQAGLRCAVVSNGHATPECLDFLHPVLDAFKVDLKTMQEKQYHALGGKLSAVLDTIRGAHELGLWVEVVTLLIPGFNDSPEELWEASRFLVSVSPDIPWHVTAFHPDYRRENTPPTSAHALQQAAEIGQEAGLRYVYAGNLPGRVGSLENTFCPACSALLIERRGYHILNYTITPQGTCPKCGKAIAGLWPTEPRPPEAAITPHRV